jgi:hypothetical protein
VGVLTAAGLLAVPFVTGVVYMGSNILRVRGRGLQRAACAAAGSAPGQ